MTTDDSKDRLFLLDNIKGILIFLVVLGHSLELYRTDHLIVQILYMFIYLFHMPAFVFISGYFSKDVDKCRSTAFKSFFIPFILFNTLWSLITVILTQDFSRFSFITPGWALWYLLSMFFWRLFLKDLVKLRFILPISFFIGLGAGIFGEFNSMLSLSRTLVFFPFFLLGYFTHEERLLSLKKPSRFCSIVILLSAVIFSTLASYYNILPVEFLYGSDSFYSHTLPIWIGVLSRLFLYVVGLCFIFALPNIVTAKETFFSKVGKNTFSIYILHTYLLALIFVVNYFIPLLWVRLLVCFLASILITSCLSTNYIKSKFDYFLCKITSILLRY